MIKPVLLWTAIVIIALAVITFVAGQYARSRLAKKFPAPGKMIHVAGNTLHVHCQGEGAVTVILEAGLNDFSLHWNRIQGLLAQHAHTCSYDRAGLGWSKARTTPGTIQNMAQDLHQVIQATGANQPLILVGHSFGSLIVRLYTHIHPENVRALVLVDPANEFMAERLSGYREAIQSAAKQFRNLQTIASTGLIALATGNIPAGQLDGEALEQYRAVLAYGSFFKGAYAESSAMLDNLKIMQQLGSAPLPSIPVVVISHGETRNGGASAQPDTIDQGDAWSELQADLVRRLHARQVISQQSEHSIQLSEPELVYKTILELILSTKAAR